MEKKSRPTFWASSIIIYGKGSSQVRGITENKHIIINCFILVPKNNLKYLLKSSAKVFRATISHQPFNLTNNNYEWNEIQKYMYLDICFIDISEEILYPILVSHIVKHHKSLSSKPVKEDICMNLSQSCAECIFLWLNKLTCAESLLTK